MPFVWRPVHDTVYTEPPGEMGFIADWGLNPVYDEVTNPEPVQSLIFSAVTTFKLGVATASLTRGEPRYFGAGFLWLKKNWFIRDDYFEEIHYFRQGYFGHRFISIEPVANSSSQEARFDKIHLSFNSSRIESVRLLAYPPPVWQEDE